jgi:hypothetical protein
MSAQREPVEPVGRERQRFTLVLSSLDGCKVEIQLLTITHRRTSKGVEVLYCRLLNIRPSVSSSHCWFPVQIAFQLFLQSSDNNQSTVVAIISISTGTLQDRTGERNRIRARSTCACSNEECGEK